MPLTRKQKEQRVQQMQKDISSATSAVFVAFDGVSVDDGEALRGELYEQGANMRVIPKRLLALALENAELDFDPTQYDRQMAVVWGDDPVSPAQILHKFAKERENIELVSGVLEEEVVSAEQVTALAKLPTREQLLGQLVSVLSGPMRGLVGALSGNQRQLVYVLKAIEDGKQ